MPPLPNRLRGKPVAGDRRLGVDQVADSGQGFLILDEVLGREETQSRASPGDLDAA